MAQRIAGIDYGTVRIGIAIADLSVAIASPLEIYQRQTPDVDAKYFRKLAREEALVKFVVGLPVHLSGEESQKSYEARQFAKWLTEITELPVDLFDERYTSSEAEEMLQAANLTKKRRKAKLDALAAQIMLTAYLEAGARSEENPGSLG
ncbi:Holliday junction resolvase RuvX [Aeoliella sp. ICT_H6.2]|uniref:Putative pre-16S rRNA nuclease n=1 Tax=Aeoliella straminimaris TaxID=2954799 RepID=A0A9X2FEP0_9BACT|nr:Holliday junction resolvase RuvX [Aeoliella straminimaris]MCO6046833.1 Holliday junction resolvase RuvX [Aeoliella straminimaris]